MARILSLLTAMALAGCALPSTSAAAAPATQVINVVPVVDGRPANGYHEAGSTSGIIDCTHPSPSAVSPGIYLCNPQGDFAEACYPSTPEMLLCVDFPWNRELQRDTASHPLALPPVTPIAKPVPFAVMLDDGTRCRLRNRGAWYAIQFKRSDGYAPVWHCQLADHGTTNGLARDGDPEIDRSTALWTIKTGLLGGGDHPEPPVTHTVTTAWFAAGEGT